MKYILLFLISLMTSGCLSNKEEIKKKYSIKTINYFHEIAFFPEDHKNYSNPFIQKWENNIKYSVKGDLSRDEIIRVDSIASFLNTFPLPIKLVKNQQIESSNLVIEFGSRKNLEVSKERGAQGIFTASNGVIEKSEIKFVRDPSLSNDMRSSILLEEMVQILGIPGDSYAYIESLFYDLRTKPNKLSEIDKNVVLMLYEDYFNAGYTLKEFESDFEDELYNINGKEKFSQFLDSSSISLDNIKEIIKNGLLKDKVDGELKICKFNYSIPLYFSGNTPSYIYNQLGSTLSELNDISPNIELHYVNTDTLAPDNNGIEFNFELDSTGSKDWITSTLYTQYKLKIPRRAKAKNSIRYSNPRNLKRDYLAVLNCIIENLCLTTGRGNYFYENDFGEYQLKPQFKDILYIYYHNSLPLRFTKSELNQIIDN